MESLRKSQSSEEKSVRVWIFYVCSTKLRFAAEIAAPGIFALQKANIQILNGSEQYPKKSSSVFLKEKTTFITSIIFREEKPYCATCFGELFAKRCASCSQPITGQGGTR
jgi:hypothetical protein